MTLPASSCARLCIALFALVGLVAGCESTELERVPDGQVDASRKSQAETFATTVLGAWAKDEYPALGDGATEEMRSANSPEAQQKADKKLEAEAGSFQSLAFQEMQRTKPPRFDVYRFKGTFDKSPSPIEVRVVHDVEGKVTAFVVRPWKDAP